MKHINKPAERDPNAAPKSKAVVKISGQEMRDALMAVMTYRDQVAAATLAAPYTKHRRRFVDSKSSDKDGSVVSLW